MSTIGWVATIVVAVIAVLKFGVNFDLNAWLKDRREIRYARLQAMCPHVALEAGEDGGIAVRGLAIKPPMSVQAQCTRCHRVFASYGQTQDIVRHWATNLDELIEAEERFVEVRQTHGVLG